MSETLFPTRWKKDKPPSIERFMATFPRGSPRLGTRPRWPDVEDRMDSYFNDECLSAQLVAVAKARDLDADFGPHIGKARLQDWNLTRFAIENDYIFATTNRRDFLKECEPLDVSK
ncbi:DUF5615 family PIN-like protein [Jiella sonneratiae]|uniref:DUF5615 domain-containing protein n=1 Tax=Jiella sonneratiae TaxID=2816856 RepID=A0ABS3IZ56_9HYPH|nr:DUF5615 family PIN-like protein [Jiella sonneratiae]MBO0902699.1 hypothetical protein [Jiella sonneratiae]